MKLLWAQLATRLNKANRAVPQVLNYIGPMLTELMRWMPPSPGIV